MRPEPDLPRRGLRFMCHAVCWGALDQNERPCDGVAVARRSWERRGSNRGCSRTERESVAVAIDGSGLLVCHHNTLNRDRDVIVLKDLTPPVSTRTMI
jgi:hypothetical protein